MTEISKRLSPECSANGKLKLFIISSKLTRDIRELIWNIAFAVTSPAIATVIPSQQHQPNFKDTITADYVLRLDRSSGQDKRARLSRTQKVVAD
jgi:hypothetical protein